MSNSLLSQPSEAANSQSESGSAHKSLGWAIFALALPVLGEQFFNILVGLFDTWLSGRISKQAIAAVGLASYIGWLATLLSGFVGVGATALVARASGARDTGSANRFTNQSVGLAGFLGAALAILLFFWAPLLTRMMGLAASAHPVAVQYLRIEAAGQFLFAYMLIGAACLRGAGDTRTPMLVIILVNIINVPISACLALGLGPFPNLGAAGIAIGTTTARSLGGIILLVVLFKGRSGLKLRFNEMKLRAGPVRRILNIGGPAGLDSALMWSGQFFFLTFISRVTLDPQLGLAAYAAHMIGVRIESLAYLPAMAWGTAAATLVGQALGAGNPQRARKTGHLAALQLAPWGLALTIAYLLGADWIFEFWSHDPLVKQQGAPALRMIGWAQPSLIVMIIYIMALRGAGDTRFPLLINVGGVFGVRVPLAYLCGVTLKGGLIGAWVGMLVDLILRSLLALWRFSRGSWTERVI